MSKKNIKNKEENYNTNIFNEANYKLFVIGVLVVSLGYLLMAGGKSPDPGIFDEKEVYSFRRITLAPIIVITGFCIVYWGILHNKKVKN